MNEKHQVRLAYGRSVNRAEFREIVPYVYYDFALDANITGNVNLKNAYANNMDLRYEFYPAPGETVTIGGFYKRFDNPIEQTYMEAGSGLQYTYHNADHAECFRRGAGYQEESGLYRSERLELRIQRGLYP